MKRQLLAKFKDKVIPIETLTYRKNKDRGLFGTLTFKDKDFNPNGQEFDIICSDINEDELAIIGCKCESYKYNNKFTYVAQWMNN